MNTELLWQVSEKLAEVDADVSILDDCVRGNLYREKIYQLVSENTRGRVASQFMNDLSTYIVGLPEVRLRNVNAFLELHQSREISRFREIVTHISLERDEAIRTWLVRRELYQANDQALRPGSDSFSKVNLLGLVLGVGTAAAILTQQPAWLSAFGFASASFALLPELRQMRDRLSLRQKWNWFVRLKSFAEKQAGFDTSAEIPWPLCES